MLATRRRRAFARKPEAWRQASVPPEQAAVGPDTVAPPENAFRPPAANYDERSAASETFALLRHLWRSGHRRRIGVLAAGIVAVLVGNMIGQIRLNEWHGTFFDALDQQHLDVFGQQLLVFLVIVGGLLTLVVGQTWMQEMLKVRLREWLTHHLLDEWLVAGRAYRLGLAGQIGVNPDQRIEEDTRKLTELSAVLGVGLLQAVLLLVSFIGILWGLSSNVVFVLDGSSFTIPGYMVWCAILYAFLGSLLTWRVGVPLIGLNAERYAREADLRFALVRVSESAESIALFGGEKDERRQLEGNLDRVITAMRGLSVGLSRLTWITSGYGWIAIVVPIVVASPGYFSGGLTLGGMMMVVGAFNQVQASLRWFVDSFPQIADWRATLRRVSAFKAAVARLDEIDEAIDSISLVRGPEDQLAFDGVSVLLSDGRVVIAEATVEIGRGERVLIVGESGAGKSTLFRAVAGLWPWGSGTITLPDPETMMFMPQRPYLPLGSLRAAITYPDRPDAFPTAEVEAVVKRVGLSEFLSALDLEARLDKSLSLGQQQLVGFARLLLHKPAWVFLDEATSALDEVSQRRVMSIFDQELAGATVLSIGHRPGLEAFHTRTLHLIRTPRGATLHHKQPAAAAPIWRAPQVEAAANIP
ncbi:putative ATP-binding cassette transporter [Tistlia consotensis]|uniref:Putative ATP-binding cassette transporter n=1 Tax=Tistlia consotensis USBA 355 TaxID=560819 RepID=A0A1Y6CMS8_9PROT|nr:ABC transporter ATP-binding protein/permease [Tistlia consotensis]SMF78306.1 putative ATP-binding cassette transporter [Tistlia consotensis USBA 355]SNS18266.1 putative ATP-binding cassette transporter [Tistlia consotensis]